jgi:hypothetical protein
MADVMRCAAEYPSNHSLAAGLDLISGGRIGERVRNRCHFDLNQLSIIYIGDEREHSTSTTLSRQRIFRTYIRGMRELWAIRGTL